MDSLKKILFFLALLVVFLSGCAALPSRPVPQIPSPPSECKVIFEKLDEKIEGAGVKDAADFPIPGFPYLRANRFLVALGKQLKEEPEKDFWAQWMKELALKGRRAEIRNLPEDAVQSLTGKMGGEGAREGLFSQFKVCSGKMLDRTPKDFYDAVQVQAKIPDEYSTFLRVIGLHPITGIPVAVATENIREKFKTWFAEDINKLPVEGSLKTYVPEGGIFLNGQEIRRALMEAKKNPLRVPRLDQEQEKKLARAFAPVIIQDIAESFDAIGTVGWQGKKIWVFPEKPTVYYYFGNSFLNGQPILQIHYVMWYGAREGKIPPWTERGHLDGLTIRFSLDPQGRLFMVDIMSNCGCYHLFAPDAKRMDRILSPPSSTPPFVPQDLPGLQKRERLGVRVNSGWHQVQRLLAVSEPADSISYELAPYEILESLPHGGDRRMSIFDPEGVIPGTERIERFFLFPMGVPHVGSMRQRGHHAIDFIGRAHFDDPDLFERNFILK